MNDPLFPTPDGPLDKLVRRTLDADADAAAAADVWGKAKARKPGVAWFGWAMRGLVAAAALGGVLVLWPGGEALASPAEIVARARDVHAAGGAREYMLTAEPPAGLARRFPKVDFGHEVSVWTRGDRFRVDPAPGGGVWGQDEAGNVWMAPTAKAGVWFRGDEIPPAFMEVLAVRRVHLPAILDEVLAKCEIERGPDDGPAVTLEARGEGSLRRAELVIGPGDVVRRMTLVRRLPAGAEVTITLELRAQGDKPDEFFRLAGAVEKGGEVIGPDQPLRRVALLTRHLMPR